VLIVASNRGPDPSGTTSGGLEPIISEALRGPAGRAGARWICSDGGSGGAATWDLGPVHVERLPIARRDLAGYYDEISNRVLWFVHHGLWEEAPAFGRAEGSHWEAFRRVNERFASRIAARLRPGDDVLVQDYHLSLVPRIVRRSRSRARILHFSHTPFAEPADFDVLPPSWRRALILGLLGADIVGFAATEWADDFLACAAEVRGVSVDRRTRTVRAGARTVRVRVYPVGAAEGTAEGATMSAKQVDRLAAETDGMKVVMRADRVEPSKNAVRGFLAYETYLRANPRMRDRVQFLALLSPSRTSLPEYRAEAVACRREVRRINRELGSERWLPIRLRIADDHPRVLAGFSRYDALLVNSVRDGTNLVALEGPMVNARDGVLILSRRAGVWARLGRYALGVNPLDVPGTARAIDRALSMPLTERRRRARGLARAATAVTPQDWLAAQVRDLEGR